MTPSERHQLVLTLFDQACDLPHDERGRFLNERCPDGLIRVEVDALLREDDSEDAFIDASAPGQGLGMLAAAALPDEALRAPERIGRYTVVREIGRGGMGVIYEAEQQSPKRRVALKVLQPRLVARELLRRFQHEAHVLGQLQHAGIAQIYEAGWAELQHGRQPFFAMEFIDGLPINQFVQANEPDTGAVLELVARVCDAVQHAHQKGVIHRDLKPSNVLVLRRTDGGPRTGSSAERSGTGSFTQDGIGQPKVLDFGIARVTDADLQTVTVQTEVGQLVGTLAYMSPEQLGGKSAELDTRCDVYALGVMLYELLAGRRPHDLAGLAIVEAARVVWEQEPQRLGTWNRTLRGDVETIVAKALEKDRERRYATAAELAADIRRHLTDQPIDARRASTWYQLRKLARRNRGLVAGLAVAGVALASGAVGTGLALIEARQQRDDAITAKNDADESRRELETVVDFQTRMLSDVDLTRVGGDIGNRLRNELARTRDGASGTGAAWQEQFATYLDDINMTNVARDVFKSQVVDRSLATLDATPPQQPRTQSTMRNSLAQTYLGLSLAEPAIEQIDAALELVDDDDPLHHELLHQKAQALEVLGRHDEAVALLESLADDLQAVRGADDRDVIALRAQITTDYTILGRYEDALSVADEALALVKRRDGDLSEQGLWLQYHIAAVHQEQGSFDEVERTLREVIAVGTERLGAEHNVVLKAQSLLGGAMLQVEQAADAEPIFRSRLERLQRTLGDEHADTAGAKSDLGLALIRLQRFDEAEPLLRDALDVRRRLQPDSDALIGTQRNLAGLLFNTGRREEGLELQLSSLPVSRRILGADHPQTLGLQNNIITSLMWLNRLDEAEEHVIESRARCGRVLGPDDLRTISACVQHNLILSRMRRHSEAIVPATEAYETAMRVRPPGDGHRISIRLLYGGTLADVRRFEESEDVLCDTYAEAVATHGRRSMLAGFGIRRLIALYETWSEAEPDGPHSAELEHWREALREIPASVMPRMPGPPQ